MRLLKAIILAPIACMLLVSFSNDALAQRKKKKPVRTEAELENTHWRLYEIDGKPYVTPMDQREAYITLKGGKNNMLEGYTGCNIITGSYVLGKEELLTFEPATTERLCDDMSTEEYVLRTLNDANRFELNGLHLLLFNGTYLLAIFEAKYYDEEKK